MTRKKKTDFAPADTLQQPDSVRSVAYAGTRLVINSKSEWVPYRAYLEVYSHGPNRIGWLADRNASVVLKFFLDAMRRRASGSADLAASLIGAVFCGLTVPFQTEISTVVGRRWFIFSKVEQTFVTFTFKDGEDSEGNPIYTSIDSLSEPDKVGDFILYKLSTERAYNLLKTAQLADTHS